MFVLNFRIFDIPNSKLDELDTGFQICVCGFMLVCMYECWRQLYVCMGRSLNFDKSDDAMVYVVYWHVYVCVWGRCNFCVEYTGLTNKLN